MNGFPVTQAKPTGNECKFNQLKVEALVSTLLLRGMKGTRPQEEEGNSKQIQAEEKTRLADLEMRLGADKTAYWRCFQSWLSCPVTVNFVIYTLNT